MAVQLKQNKLKLSSAITGALVIGGGLLLLRTFPHVKALFKFGASESKREFEDDNTPVPIEKESIQSEDIKYSYDLSAPGEVSNLSDHTIKSILLEKEINPPPNATHDELVAILKSSK